MRPVVDDAVEERLALDALAHEPALHVGEGDDDRVDAPVADQLPSSASRGCFSTCPSWLSACASMVVMARASCGDGEGRRDGRPSSGAGWSVSGPRQAVAGPLRSSAARSNSFSISVSSASWPMTRGPWKRDLAQAK